LVTLGIAGSSILGCGFPITSCQRGPCYTARVVTHDSQQFTDAMEKVWHPPVLAKQNTPRAAKRFVNRVRYLSLRNVDTSKRLLGGNGSCSHNDCGNPRSPKIGNQFPNRSLIAMAAVEQVQPIWIYDETAFQQVIGDNGIAGLISHDVPVLLRSILLHRGFRSRCFCDRELPRCSADPGSRHSHFARADYRASSTQPGRCQDVCLSSVNRCSGSCPV